MSNAQSATKGAVVKGTNTKQVCAWLRPQQYTASIGLQSEPFFDQFSPQQWTKIISAFTHAIREGRICDAKHHKSIKSDSVWSGLDCISQVFKLADQPDPGLDWDGKCSAVTTLRLQLNRPTNQTPSSYDRICPPPILYIITIFHRQSPVQIVCRSLLFCNAVLWIHPSHRTKKDKVAISEKHKFLHEEEDTTSLRSLSSPSGLHLSHMQKKESKSDIITQYRFSDKLLCPDKVWSSIIQRIVSYANTTPDTTVNYYMHHDSTVHKFQGKDLLSTLRFAAASLGHDELGFHPEELGLPFAHSSAAMAMYLAGVLVFTIMLLGSGLVTPSSAIFTNKYRSSAKGAVRRWSWTNISSLFLSLHVLPRIAPWYPILAQIFRTWFDRYQTTLDSDKWLLEARFQPTFR